MNESAPTPRRRVLPLIAIGLIFLACGYAVYRRVVPQAPVFFAQAHALPLRAQWADGAWYWIEAPDKQPARLVRATGSETKDIAKADEIGEFCISSKNLIWSARTGSEWTIVLSVPGGGDRKDIWHGTTKPVGIWQSALDGSAPFTVYWLEATPALVPAAAQLPPLGGSCKVMAVVPANPSKPPDVVATLMEPNGQQILGFRDKDLIVSTFRPGAPGTTVLYSVPPGGGTPLRVAGASARQDALIARDGSIYWAAQSREASQPGSAYCIRRLDKAGKTETLCDWLPYGGHLLETGGEIIYIDGTYMAKAWPIAGIRELPRPLATPADHGVVGVGGGEVLIRSITEDPKTVTVYRVAR